MNKFGQRTYTYLIGWTSRDTWYYGYRGANKVSPEEDLWIKYFTSSDKVKAFRTLYGEPDVVKIDATFNDRFEAREHEERYLTEVDAVAKDNWLNQANGGKSFASPEVRDEKYRLAVTMGKLKSRYRCSDETKEKMRQAKLNMTPEQKAEKVRKFKETKAKRQAGLIPPIQSMLQKAERFQELNPPKEYQKPRGRRKMTPEELEKHRALLRERYPNGGGPGGYRTKDPAAAAKKISAALLGKPKSAEARANISKSRQGVLNGPTSDEVKAKISAAKKGSKYRAKTQAEKDAQAAKMREFWSKKKAMQVELSASPCFSIEIEADLSD